MRKCEHLPKFDVRLDSELGLIRRKLGLDGVRRALVLVLRSISALAVPSGEALSAAQVALLPIERRCVRERRVTDGRGHIHMRWRHRLRHGAVAQWRGGRDAYAWWMRHWHPDAPGSRPRWLHRSYG